MNRRLVFISALTLGFTHSLGWADSPPESFLNLIYTDGFTKQCYTLKDLYSRVFGPQVKKSWKKIADDQWIMEIAIEDPMTNKQKIQRYQFVKSGDKADPVRMIIREEVKREGSNILYHDTEVPQAGAPQLILPFTQALREQGIPEVKNCSEKTVPAKKTGSTKEKNPSGGESSKLQKEMERQLPGHYGLSGDQKSAREVGVDPKQLQNSPKPVEFDVTVLPGHQIKYSPNFTCADGDKNGITIEKEPFNEGESIEFSYSGESKFPNKDETRRVTFMKRTGADVEFELFLNCGGESKTIRRYKKVN